MIQFADYQNKTPGLKAFFSRYFRVLAGVLALLILVLGGYFFVLPKYYQARGATSQTLTLLSAEAEKRRDYLEALKQLAVNYQKINQAEVNRLKAILPTDKDLPGLFVQLQALAEENNFLLADLNISELADRQAAGSLLAAEPAAAKKSAGGQLKKLAINLNLVGSKSSGYPELKRFLDAVEQNLRLFDVEAVYFSPDSPKYSLTLFTYYFSSE